MRRARAVFLVALAGASGACAIISADDYVGPDQQSLPVEAAPTDDVTTQPEDAQTLDAAFLAPPSTILSGAVSNATGRAQQSHLFYSKSAARWVFFTFDSSSTKRLATRISSDFAKWTDGASLTLPFDHENDGRDLAVAPLPSDSSAFHLSISLFASPMFSHHHVRASLASDVTFGALAELGNTSNMGSGEHPDGPAVVATPAGSIFEVSGYATPDGGFGNANIIPWVSTNPDNAPGWTPVFNPPIQLEVVKGACNARALVATLTGAMGVWEAADTDPKPHALRTSTYEGTTWSTPVDTGFDSSDSGAFDVNDWGIAPLGAVIHVVRRADSYSHRVYQNGHFMDGQPMVDGAHAEGSGVVLLPDTGVLRAYTLDPDGAILTASLMTSWTAWTEILPKGAARAGLTGYAGDGTMALAWLEEKVDGQAVVGWRIR